MIQQRKAQAQPGYVRPTLQRRMGPDLAKVFSKVGVQLYAKSISTIKDQLTSLFKDAISGLEEEIKAEFGRRGQQASVEHFAPWIRELVEDIIHFGMTEVSGGLEDLASDLTSTYVQEELEEEEIGTEDVEALDEEVPVEEVETVEEEPVKEVEKAEEKKPEEAGEVAPEGGLEELLTPPEGEAAAQPAASTPRVWRRKPKGKQHQAKTTLEIDLEMADILKVAGGLEKFKAKAKTPVQAKKLIAAIQQRIANQITAKHPLVGVIHAVSEVEMGSWFKQNY